MLKITAQPQAKISTIFCAVGKYLDDFWRRRRKIRRFLASCSKFLTIFSAAGKIFRITIVLMLLGALSLAGGGAS
jgi:hypothetical protein